MPSRRAPLGSCWWATRGRSSHGQLTLEISIPAPSLSLGSKGSSPGARVTSEIMEPLTDTPEGIHLRADAVDQRGSTAHLRCHDAIYGGSSAATKDKPDSPVDDIGPRDRFVAGSREFE
jgi:hypothetical protein